MLDTHETARVTGLVMVLKPVLHTQVFVLGSRICPSSSQAVVETQETAPPMIPLDANPLAQTQALVAMSRTWPRAEHTTFVTQDKEPPTMPPDLNPLAQTQALVAMSNTWPRALQTTFDTQETVPPIIPADMKPASQTHALVGISRTSPRPSHKTFVTQERAPPMKEGSKPAAQTQAFVGMSRTSPRALQTTFVTQERVPPIKLESYPAMQMQELVAISRTWPRASQRTFEVQDRIPPIKLGLNPSAHMQAFELGLRICPKPTQFVEEGLAIPVVEVAELFNATGVLGDGLFVETAILLDTVPKACVLSIIEVNEPLIETGLDAEAIKLLSELVLEAAIVKDAEPEAIMLETKLKVTEDDAEPETMVLEMKLKGAEEDDAEMVVEEFPVGGQKDVGITIKSLDAHPRTVALSKRAYTWSTVMQKLAAPPKNAAFVQVRWSDILKTVFSGPAGPKMENFAEGMPLLVENSPFPLNRKLPLMVNLAALLQPFTRVPSSARKTRSACRRCFFARGICGERRKVVGSELFVTLTPMLEIHHHLQAMNNSQSGSNS
jgi:hypothetical protein